AEDGIRDFHVTGVQTCALPIYATGPGIGIQLKHGPNKGRLVIPAIGRNIQSDDHGVTWYESGRLIADTNEPTVVELTDGTLMRRSEERRVGKEERTQKEPGRT